MKKRKRKMKQNKLRCLPDVIVLGSLLVALNVLQCALFMQAVAERHHIVPQFDEDHHLLNLAESSSSSSSAGAAVTSPARSITHQVYSHPQALSNRPAGGSEELPAAHSAPTDLISGSDSVGGGDKSPAEAGAENSLEDLLSIESSRLLTIGRQQQQPSISTSNQAHANPPYASTNLTSISAVNGSATFTTNLEPRLNAGARLSTSVREDDDSDTKLTRDRRPPPIFIRVIGRRPTTSAYSPLANSSQPSPLPPVGVPVNGLLAVPAPSAPWPNAFYFAQASGGGGLPTPALVAATQPLPTLPVYADFARLNRTSATSTVVASKQQQQESGHSLRGNETSELVQFNITQRGDGSSWPPTPTPLSPYSNAGVGEQETNDADEAANRTAQPLSTTTYTSARLPAGQQFPSLVPNEDQPLEHQHQEKQQQPFEGQQSSGELSTGNYQRTNATNMSWTQLLRQATESNVMESLMVTNKSMVSLLCNTDHMLLRLKFRQPFRGAIMTTLDRLQSCRLVGNGSLYYEMRIALHDCGTHQEMPRLFINNIQIQFRQPSFLSSSASSSALDLAEDELKTIICSYPIRPRAPPPPELPADGGAAAGLPERIVEAPPSAEPAKLVHYEPLVLISGLLLFSLALLGLTTSAYLFTKRRASARSRRSRGGFSDSSGGAGSTFSSSRLYRTSPSQAANYLVAPPLIGMGGEDSKTSTATTKKTTKRPTITTGVKYASIDRGSRRGGPRQTSPSDSRSGGGGGGDRQMAATLPKSTASDLATSRRDNFTMVSANPELSSDSLAGGQNGDQSSVTTIEIPFAGKSVTPARPAGDGGQRYAGTTTTSHSLKMISKPTRRQQQQVRTSPRPPTKPPRPKSGEHQTANQTGHSSTSDSASTSTVANVPTATTKPSTLILKKSKRARLEHESELTRSKYFAPGSAAAAAESTPSKVAITTRQQQQQQQEGDREPERPALTTVAEAPRFGSMRATLTSPKQFRRLQEIARLFDEILIEDHVQQEKGGAVRVVYKTRLSPSKYKGKILDKLDEAERRRLGETLAKDEMFRSMVVESTDRGTFLRKLRNNPVYSAKFKPDTWELLEEILLDPELSSARTSGADDDDDVDTSDDHERDHLRPQSTRQLISADTGRSKPVASGTPAWAGQSFQSDLRRRSRRQTHHQQATSQRSSRPTTEDEEDVLARLDLAARQVETATSRTPPLTSGQRDSLESSSSSSEEAAAAAGATGTRARNKEEEPVRGADSAAQRSRGEANLSSEALIRVSQFNTSRTTREATGLTGTMINIDSVTNFTNSSKDFSTYTRSSIEHTRYDNNDDAESIPSSSTTLPYVDEEVASYEYAKETFKLAPKLSSGASSTAHSRRLLATTKASPWPTTAAPAGQPDR